MNVSHAPISVRVLEVSNLLHVSHALIPVGMLVVSDPACGTGRHGEGIAEPIMAETRAKKVRLGAEMLPKGDGGGRGGGGRGGGGGGRGGKPPRDERKPRHNRR
jgi:hypothetical protein